METIISAEVFSTTENGIFGTFVLINETSKMGKTFSVIIPTETKTTGNAIIKTLKSFSKNFQD